MEKRMTWLKRLSTAFLLALCCACSMMPTEHGDIYDLRREAQVAYAGNQDDRAEKLLLGLARAAPNDAETWFYLGNLYARTQRPDQAVQAYQKSLMLKSDDGKAWYNLGVVRMREAWASFIQAYAHVPAGDPLQGKLEEMISVMEKMPLEGLKRAPKPAAANGDVQREVNGDVKADVKVDTKSDAKGNVGQ
jgi:tetratricopeptide (TPR) repeat protein